MFGMKLDILDIEDEKYESEYPAQLQKLGMSKYYWNNYGKISI